MRVSISALGNAAQVVAIARDVLAELALADEGPESALALTEIMRERITERVRTDGQLAQLLGSPDPKQRGALALVAVVCAELTECLG